jgi:cell division protein ZapA
MSEAAVQLKIAGQVYRVVTSASPEDLGRLSARVDEALRAVTPGGRQPSEQALVLAAITLAHELEEERRARLALEARYERKLRELLSQVETALAVPPPQETNAPRESLRDDSLPAPALQPALQEVYALRRLREREAVGSQR